MNLPLPFVPSGAKAWGMARNRSPRHPLFRQRWFADDIIITCVRWYLRFKLSYRDVEELLAERGLHAEALAEPISYRSIGIDRKIPRRKERTNLAIPRVFRRAKTIGIRFGLSGFAELGDSRNRKADALREKSLHRNPARHGLDRRHMRRAC